MLLIVRLHINYELLESKKRAIKQVVTFLVIISIISTGLFIWMFGGAEDNPVAIVLMMFTPGISAIITSVIFKEKIRTFGWKTGKLKYLLMGYILPIIVSLIAYGLLWLTKYSDFTTANVVNYKWAKMLGFDLPAPFIVGLFSKMIIASLLTTLVVFGEEVGWSGFLTQKLRNNYSIPTTSVLVGIIWAIWHFPAIIGGFYGNGSPLWLSLPGFTLVLVGASFIRTVLVEKSNSLWTGVVLHASHNVILMGMFNEMTAKEGEFNVHYFVSETGPFLGLIYVIVAIIFWRLQINKSVN
jgi:membrane protease YdiL (CAAX protease family)